MDAIAMAVLSGLFGPNLARRLAKYRYRVIFFTTILVIYLGAFAALMCDGGLGYAVSVFVSKTFSLVAALVPVGIALLVILVVFIASIGSHDK